MKKRIVTFVLAVLMLVTMMPITAMGANSYTINGVTVKYTDSSITDNCWSYANEIYKKIWGKNFTNSFDDSDNYLRNLSDTELTLTESHLKSYISNAALGAVIRVTNATYLHGSDGWGHSQILVSKDSNGFTVFQSNVSSSRKETYYTWSNYIKFIGADYDYIKYIKWPGASSHTHSYGKWYYNDVRHWKVCSVCNERYWQNHIYDSWITTTAATCTADGSKYRSCTVCGYKQTETIPATGHNYSTAWKSDSSNHWHVCSCGAKSGKDAHTYGSWKTSTAATHTTSGSKYRTCTVCGYKQMETIQATGHSYDAIWHTNATNHWHECSCGDKCDKAEHSFKDGICSVCKYASPPAAITVEEDMSQGITAEIAAALSSNEAVNSFTDTGLDSALAGTAYAGKTATVKASVESVTKTGDTTTITFDIAPYVDGENVSGAVNGSKVTARVPLTAEFTKYAKVEHPGDDDAYPEVKTGSDGAPYIDIVTTHFSSFTVSNVDKLPDDGGDDPNDPTPPDDPKPSGGCYVATAVYGSYDCPEVWTLRRFRDETLAQTWYGRAFIHTYYAISPTIVKWFGDTDWFKNMWRGTLDKMVANLNAEGVPDTPYDDIDW